MHDSKPTPVEVNQEIARMEQQFVPDDGDHVWASEEEKRAQWERETRATHFGDPETELKREGGK